MEQDEAARVRALGEIAAEFDLDAIRVRTGDVEIEIVRRDPTVVAAPPLAAAPVHAVPAGPTLAAAAAAAPADHKTPPANVRPVTAPVVGVFYRAPAPGADSFVEVGSRVQVGTTLCILEAMKLMNEIATDYAGVVNRILVENGELVTLGQELFWIEV
ncbi:MAG: acetyl-CoA carboxylase biotin carboxyl carrier protein [Vulcanimicrobiaceae bacterium]|jgi:acetyl-CoA carboxylase biotin carboxyl carrier protein